MSTYTYALPGDPGIPTASNVDLIVYEDGLGGEVDLSTITDEQYKEGMDGRFMAPLEHYSEQVPEQDGARYRSTRVLPNLLTIPITIVADDLVVLRGKVRDLARGLNPRRGVRKLKVYTADGLWRYANCILESGFGADPATSGEEYDARLVLNFRAFDPYWYDIEGVSKTFASGGSQGTFFPAPPFRLGGSTVFSAFTETNDGDVETWPVWTITGPGNGVELRNRTTDQWLTLDYEFGSGASITIDTRPGVRAVYAEDGSNLFPYLDGDLWSLVEGDNDVTVEMIQTNENTSIELTYQPRYLGV